MLAIGPFAFASPWLLLSLLSLPVLWWLLRITPPAPKHVLFPAIRLLMGLQVEEKTPAAAPWWLILLRLVAAALLMLALAHPLFNPGTALTGTGPLILVVDDGWASAKHWTTRRDTLLQLVDQADRQSRPIVILPTAPAADGKTPSPLTLLRPAEARGELERLQPKPWPVDRAAAARRLAGLEPAPDAAVYWAGDDIGGAAAREFAESLLTLGQVVLLSAADSAPPLLLKPTAPAGTGLGANVRRPEANGPAELVVVARATDGRPVGRQVARFESDSVEAETTFELPLELRNEIAAIAVEGENSAGAVGLIDERWRRRPVGLVSESSADTGLALLSETYYLERALAPVGQVTTGNVDALLQDGQAVILLPDHVPASPDEMDALAAWVRAGGTLVRFAGPRLAASDVDNLTPVALRKGGRALGGALLWTKPARLAPFPEASPYEGLVVPADVSVVKQVLAEPTPELSQKTWARLEDGTPLVTADRRGDGWLILIHTTANADWSNLALSGLFVQMMGRTVGLSRGVAQVQESARALPPFETLDGLGRLGTPSAAVLPLSLDQDEEIVIGPQHPPGYYGTETTRHALNLGSSIDRFEPLRDLPAGIERDAYGVSSELDLKPALLVAALVLLLCDALITLAMRGLLPLRWRSGAAAGAAALAIVTATLSFSDSAHAQGRAEQFALDATLQTRLAHVRTGDAQVDRISETGLATLTRILDRRTAVEAGEPMAINLDRDELSFFPLLYWPITTAQESLSADTIARLNTYMARGGTIFFDTRDAHLRGIGGTRAGDMLRRLARGLDIPPLIAIPPDHVLTKAFYLMQDFPGRWSGAPVWVERPGARANDGVSRIIVGGNDWAAAWAANENGQPLYPAVPGGERQREMAYRFGINLVMYTLTGNYKADQVHVPAILERLGQ